MVDSPWIESMHKNVEKNADIRQLDKFGVNQVLSLLALMLRLALNRKVQYYIRVQLGCPISPAGPVICGQARDSR